MILLLVAWGWTINFLNVSEFDFFLPVLIIVNVFHLFFGLLNVMLSEKEFIFILEGYHTGILTEIYRFGILVYFLIGVVRNYKLARQNIKRFFLDFSMFGFFFFIHFYLWMLFTNLFIKEEDKLNFLVLGNGIMRMNLIIMFWMLFTSKKYCEVSFKGRTSLPSGANDVKFM